MTDILKLIPADMHNKLTPQPQPEWINPMLATLTYTYFSDPDWIFECKLDGERTIIHKLGDTVTLYSRNKKKQNKSYPELVEALEKIPGNFILDGEIVAFDKEVSSFSKLQRRLQVKSPDPQLLRDVPAFLYIFDILYYDQWLLTHLPLRQRKEILKQELKFNDPLRYLDHRNEAGEVYLKEACQKGWEGLIAKDANAPYETKRSKKWLKFKCGHGQEFVIGGYTEPKGSRVGFGALLLGYYKDNKLLYAGRVGTGFNTEFLQTLHKRMEKIKQKSCPFYSFDEKDTDITWIKPQLVGEVGFTEWTRDGKLRHPRFIGLRDDKEAKDVVLEE